MCFCAGASFSVGVALLLVGAIALLKTKDTREWMFASIPLIFGVQQLIEGVVWVADSQSIWHSVNTSAGYMFLFFAFVIWPIWIPLSLFLIETNDFRQRLLGYVALYGTLCSGLLGMAIVYFGNATTIQGDHIYYTLQNYFTPLGSILSTTLFAAATILPFFLSSHKILWALGSLATIFCIFSSIMYRVHFVSIWCFFAAILSIIIVGFLPIVSLEKETVNELVPEEQYEL